MIFKIKRRDRGFVMVDRQILENPKLSWKAKGLMAYLLSRPDDWKVMMADLEARSTEGSSAIRSALIELRDAGHARLDRSRSEDGTLAGSYWNVFEEPQLTETQETLISDTEIDVSRKPVKPESGQPDATKKDRKTKKELGPRPRNLLFDALCAVDQSNPEEAAKVNGGKIAKALFQIKRMTPDVTPEEINRRAANYRSAWPSVSLTATALAANWAKFGTALHATTQKPNGRGFSGSNLSAFEELDRQMAAGQG